MLDVSAPTPSPSLHEPPKSCVPVVAIGASVGGLPAFTRLLRRLPDNTGLAFVFLQHLDPKRKSQLTALLQARCIMPVEEVTTGMKLESDHVYVVPAGHGAVYANGSFELGERAISDVPSALIDDFMIPLSAALQGRAVGVVLSGSGRDGVAGLSAIKAAGGITLCQRPSSARNDGMPNAVIAAGVADFILDPDQIADELVRLAQVRVQAEFLEPVRSEDDDQPLQQLFELLQAITGVDFAILKRPMVRRRIARRMSLSGHTRVADYVAYVRQSEKEASALHADLLIGVTSFFRDAGIYNALVHSVLPPLVEKCLQGGTLRIWVAGCATGEETYSIAMCVIECFGGRPPGKSVQIFATDIRQSAIKRARAGIYPDSLRHTVSSARLHRHFVEHKDGYQVCQAVRELCVFARHDLTRDPTFSNLDMISCRNVMIYFDADTQDRVLSKFHCALAPAGLLVLGNSESVRPKSPLFDRIDDAQRIYRRRSIPAGPTSRAQAEAFATSPPYLTVPSSAPSVEYDVRGEADRILLGRFVPAALLVDSQLQVAQFRGPTGPFMAPLSGVASLSVLKLIDESLLPALRYGLAWVQRRKQIYRRSGFLIQLLGAPQSVDIEIVPLRAQHPDNGYSLIVLSFTRQVGNNDRTRTSNAKGVGARMIGQLRDELAMMRDHLEATTSEQEGATESLRAALDELQSTNEELQVTNEELETGKEELQSTNDALSLANSVIQLRNSELDQLVHDHVSVVTSARVAAVLFGSDLRLRRATPIAARILAIPTASAGQSSVELQSALTGCDLTKLLRGAREDATPQTGEATSSSGRIYILDTRPYYSSDGVADGVVLTFEDVTELRACESALAAAVRRIAGLEDLPS